MPISDEQIRNYINHNVEKINNLNQQEIIKIERICVHAHASFNVLGLQKPDNVIVSIYSQPNFLPYRTAIVGHERNIYFLLQDQVMTEFLGDLTIRCNFCNKNFYHPNEWTIHVDLDECIISNPCKWFDDLYEIPSINQTSFDRERGHNRRVSIIRRDID